MSWDACIESGLKFEVQLDIIRQRTPDLLQEVCAECYGNMKEGKSNFRG